GSFGLGVAQFYLNFLYRSLGFDAFAIGLLAGAEALGVVAGAIPAAIFTRGRSPRAVILFGGTLTGVGIFGILIFNALPPVFLSAMLVGFGGIIASSSGAALLADATDAARRATRFGQQIALGTTAAFLSSVIAGALAAPVATLLGARPDDARWVLHGRSVPARLGAFPSIALVEMLSFALALVAAFTGALPIAVGALATRHFLMFGASGTVNAFQLSSFTPAERAGANAVFALAWSAANAVGAILSGAIRARLGPEGFTANLITLVVAYGLAALLTWRLFAAHEPSGDVGARTLAVPDSRGSRRSLGARSPPRSRMAHRALRRA